MQYTVPLVLFIAAIGFAGCLGDGEEEPSKFSDNPELRQCNQIRDDDMRREDCYIKVATVKKKPELCAEISIEGQRNLCYTQIARETGDMSVCDNIAGDEWRKSTCQAAASN